MANQCTARCRDGSRCKGRALPGESLCFAHSPTLRQRRQEGAATGGRAIGPARYRAGALLSPGMPAP